MKKRTILLSMGIAFLLLAGILFWVVYGYLNSEGFQKKLVVELSKRIQCGIRVERISPTFGCKMRFDSGKPILMAGVDFKDLKLSDAEMLPGEFFKAERLRMRYDVIGALFHGKVMIEELKFTKPVMDLDLSSTNLPPQTVKAERPTPPQPDAFPLPVVSEETFSTNTMLEQAVTRVPMPKPVPEERRQAHSPRKKQQQAWPAPPAMNLRAFVVEEGRFIVKTPDRRITVVEGVQLRSELSAEPVASASGTLHCQSVFIGQCYKFLEPDVKFFWRDDSLTIPAWSAQAWGGTLSGDCHADQTKPGIPYDMKVQASQLSVQEVLYAMEIPSGSLHGKIQAQARFDGSLEQPERSNGLGQIRITEGKIVNDLVLRMMGGYLNRADFDNVELQKCDLDFVLAAGKLQISRIQVITKDLELSGGGWVNLADKSQEFNLIFAMSGDIASKLPPAVLEGMNRRIDGYIEFPFRIWGTLKRPQNDLQARFQALAIRAIGGAIIDKIFQAVPQK